MNDSYILKGLLLAMALYVAFLLVPTTWQMPLYPISSMAINELNVEPTHSFILLYFQLLLLLEFCHRKFAIGQKVLQNTGKEIVLFGKIEAVIIAFISASLLLEVSLFKGIPTSRCNSMLVLF